MIHRLRITIEPWRIDGTIKELRIEVDVDGMRHGTVETFREADFDSRFRQMMQSAERRISEIVKSGGVKRDGVISDSSVGAGL